MQNTTALVRAGSLASVPEKQRAALITLLADEDVEVYRTIRDKILSYGQPAREWLHTYHLSNDPVLRRRAMEIVDQLDRAVNDQCFHEFCLRCGEDFDLEQAAGLLARTRYPDAHLPAYTALLDQWAKEVAERIEGEKTPETILTALNKKLFLALGFRGDEQHHLAPASCYLNCAMDGRAANPVTLSLIYLLIARRLRLPVTGIALPGYFLCRYQSPTREIYIDVYHKGKFWSKADCVKFIQTTQIGLQEAHPTAVTPRRILLEMCKSLHQIYEHLEMRQEAARVQRYVMALAK